MGRSTHGYIQVILENKKNCSASSHSYNQIFFMRFNILFSTVQCTDYLFEISNYTEKLKKILLISNLKLKHFPNT